MEDLDKIRETLLRRRDALIARIDSVTRHVRHVDEPLSSDFSEQATERENEEVMDALGEAGRRELSQLNRALHRIDEGAYGICASCGDPIPEARLKILPYTEFCVKCAEQKGRGR